MHIGIKGAWNRYSRDGDWHLKGIKDCGKWTFPFSSKDQAVKIIELAISNDVCTHAKHTLGNGGAVCLYASGSNVDDHIKVIKFMLDNKLIRLTKDYNYADMPFKFNGQSWSKEYGNPFDGLITLSDFIDLDTTEFIPAPDSTSLLTLHSFQKSKFVSTSTELKELIDKLDNYSLTKINELFLYDTDNIDFNDKIIHIAPFGYKITKLYSATSLNKFLQYSILLIAYYTSTTDSKAVANIKNREYSNVNQLFNIIEKYPLAIADKIEVSPNLVDHFIFLFNNASYDQDFINSISYILYLGLYTIDTKQFDKLFKP